MPAYDYRCKDCDHSFEARLTLKEKSDGKKVNCPACGSEQTAQAFRSMMVLGGKSTGSSCGSGGCASCSGC